MLEAACSDGATGHAFANYGYQVTLHDLEDWRAEEHRYLDFAAGDLCNRLPLAGESFDLVCSWNSFEHVANPEHALAELLRLCKKGGYVYLAFNPLWCSPLGLHALEFKMPYAQFLFSDELIESKCRQFPNVGPVPQDDAPQDHWSHGQKHMDLMNRLRVEYFRPLWQNSGCEVVHLTETKNSRHLNVIANFPLAFTGRGLTLDDVTTDGIEVLLAKK